MTLAAPPEGRFRQFLAIDWSGAAGDQHKGIALAFADAAGGPPVLIEGPWSRLDVNAMLRDELPPDTLVGLDLGIGLPFEDCAAYFPGLPESPRDAIGLWALIDELAADEPHLGANTAIASPRLRPFFRDGDREGPLFRCDGAEHGMGRFRVTERAQAAMGCRPTSNFNLVGASQVGKSSLTGMRMLHALRGHLPVWPVDPLPDRGSVIVEIYTSLAALDAGRSAGRSKMRTIGDMNHALRELASPPVPGEPETAIDDHASDALVAAAWLRRVAHQPSRWQPPALTPEIAQTEGWTFGAL